MEGVRLRDAIHAANDRGAAGHAGTGARRALTEPRGRDRMLKEFKAFVMRGNLVEIAVAFIMGLAVAAVVTAFTDVVMERSATSRAVTSRSTSSASTGDAIS